MSSLHSTAIANAERYCEEQQIQFVDQLGAGLDGIVFSTDRDSAVKALRYRELYEREREIYLRLADLGVTRLLRFKVPRYLSYHDGLMIVEMQTSPHHSFSTSPAPILTDRSNSRQTFSGNGSPRSASSSAPTGRRSRT